MFSLPHESSVEYDRELLKERESISYVKKGLCLNYGELDGWEDGARGRVAFGWEDVQSRARYANHMKISSINSNDDQGQCSI